MYRQKKEGSEGVSRNLSIWLECWMMSMWWRRWLDKLARTDRPTADGSSRPPGKILMASTQLNNDVLVEVFLRLPMQSLLRCKAVCKSWRHIIDSRTFQKLHCVKHANNIDNGVILGFIYARDIILNVSMLRLDGQEVTALRKTLNCLPNPSFEKIMSDLALNVTGQGNGLLCMKQRYARRPYIIYNLSLGKVRFLPQSPSCSLCHNHKFAGNVGFCFDNVSQDYKVVQLLFCGRRTHASIYSSMTNSWRVVSGDNTLDCRLIIIKLIKSLPTKGLFAHWIGAQILEESRGYIILSFDMKNEVFRILQMPQFLILNDLGKLRFFAKGDKFVLFIVCTNELKMFEGRIEGDELHWDFVKNVGPFHQVIPKPKALWGNNCIVLINSLNQELFIYNYVDQQFVRCLKMPTWGAEFKLFYYRGSFLSP